MPLYLGIDTSNYTTSLAIYNSDDNTVITEKKLLEVKTGELGLRQSDAVFQHTKQLPLLMDRLFSDRNYKVSAVGVSVKPRNIEGSYMPCFLSGLSVAEAIAVTNNVSIYKTSHQMGHILAALYSCSNTEFIKKKFLCFHVSGGTTDMLLCEPSDDVMNITQVGSSLDLKAGQAVDRVGLMLGLDFPCGPELEKLALQSTESYKIKPTIKDHDCCLSGVENKCHDMLIKGESKENTALFCLEYIKVTLFAMAKNALSTYGEMPVVFAGGVMSNSIIRSELSENLNCFFAKPEFSCDNAAGIAYYSYLRSNK